MIGTTADGPGPAHDRAVRRRGRPRGFPGRGPVDALGPRRLLHAVRSLDEPGPPDVGLVNDPRFRWLLPGALLPGAPTEPSDGSARPAVRTARDWVVDAVLFGFSVVCGLLLVEQTSRRADVPDPLVLVDLVVGLALCGLLWWRRRRPVTLLLLSWPTGLFSTTASAASVVLLFTVAVHCRLRTTVLLAAVYWTPGLVYFAVWPDPDLPYAGAVVFLIVMLALTVGWGLFVRSRRQLLLSLRERARLAEAEQRRGVAAARQLERTRIAREMHDVLGHRLSLLTMHAGALEFRPGAPPEQIAGAAGVIRESAHEALRDLRAAIGALREGPEDPAARPQPTLDDLPELVDECRRAGMEIRTSIHLAEAASAPAVMAGSAFRIAQEGLTNARRHAPGAPTRLIIDGSPAGGLHLEIRNARRPGPDPAPRPGQPSWATGPAGPSGPTGTAGPAGTGLLGLTERAALVGGRLEHGPTPEGEFRLYAWLPWTTP
ncbi:sensor histidine kinase [Parafrankia discariae]|uniref:sensor histidine kinase n=1 Tax=Parafrankia discariae TaxID=365528 RepID=UPI0003765EA2|nr:histidine kinase [Parafrankia discariae]